MFELTIDRFTQREVIYCVSGLVYELAPKAEHFPDYQDDLLDAYRGDPDYEEAAIDNGWEFEDGVITDGIKTAGTWEEACHTSNIDAEDYCPEIYEHWAVTLWFACQLKRKGEKIITDFFGIEAIWCRPTTGQAISMDPVIQEIYNETMKN